MFSIQKHSNYVRELYVVTKVVSKFWHYVFGHQSTIKTDQDALKHLCEQNIHALEQQRWLPTLLGYNFNIEYKPGKENIAANALSGCFLYNLLLHSVHYKLSFNNYNRWTSFVWTLFKQLILIQILIPPIHGGRISYGNKIELWFLMTNSWNNNCYINIMQLLSVAMLDHCELMWDWDNNSIGKECARTLLNLWKPALFVNKQNQPTLIRAVFYNHCLFLNKYGRMFL